MLKGDGNLYLPFTINGKDASYAFDSGANFSAMSESEAKRLGLAVQDVNTDILGSSGARAILIRVAVAKKIVIGGLRLKNVAFAVLPDTQEPFVDLPENKRGLTGIPVLIAMRTFRWSPNGTFTFSFAARHEDLSHANLSLEVGGDDVNLKPAQILTKQSTDTSSWAAGNLGIDLLNEAHTITFDFHAMTLVLQ